MNSFVSGDLTEQCELCETAGSLLIYTVLPSGHNENEVSVCQACLTELQKVERTDKADGAYWRFLTATMWSQVPAVQVLTWRLLKKLSEESWAADNLELLYLDSDLLGWAKAGLKEPVEAAPVHKDSLGNQLQNGDTVVLTRSLDVKGSSLNAKMGTVIKNIRLVTDNTEQIEGKIEGQQIVILTKYLRKQRN
jgi:protein PhnA